MRLPPTIKVQEGGPRCSEETRARNAEHLALTANCDVKKSGQEKNGHGGAGGARTARVDQDGKGPAAELNRGGHGEAKQKPCVNDLYAGGDAPAKGGRNEAVSQTSGGEHRKRVSDASKASSLEQAREERGDGV